MTASDTSAPANLPFRFCSLGSGSGGNALLVETAHTLLMVDCGFKTGEALQRLQRRGVGAERLNAIFVTHEHQDHASGVASLAIASRAVVYASRGTARHLASSRIRLERCSDMVAVTVGDVVITPFSVPHDANEPLQCTVHLRQAPQRRLGVLTDTGHVTPHIVEALNGCSALYLEFNHDPLMLRHSTYPHKLKGRIAGNYGHLSNQQAAKLLAALPAKPHTVVAAHLSESNNTPEKVQAALRDYQAAQSLHLVIANQETGFDWISCP